MPDTNYESSSTMARPITNVNPPPPLKLKENPIKEWNMFKQMFGNYSTIIKLSEHTKSYQQAVFLNALGPVGVKLFTV
jgi:hypothetical protein